MPLHLSSVVLVGVGVGSVSDSGGNGAGIRDFPVIFVVAFSRTCGPPRHATNACEVRQACLQTLLWPSDWLPESERNAP